MGREGFRLVFSVSSQTPLARTSLSDLRPSPPPPPSTDRDSARRNEPDDDVSSLLLTSTLNDVKEGDFHPAVPPPLPPTMSCPRDIISGTRGLAESRRNGEEIIQKFLAGAACTVLPTPLFSSFLPFSPPCLRLRRR